MNNAVFSIRPGERELVELPPVLMADTCFVVNSFGRAPLHVADQDICLDFIEWAGQNSVFLVSGHIFDELRGIAVKSIYEQEAANRGLGKGRWRDLFNKDKGLMSDVHNEIVRIKEAVHKAPAFEYVEYTADELFDDLTTRIMCKLGLNSMDAKLVAIGQRWGSNSVVTFDEDFAFAGGLNIFSSSWLVLRHRKDGLNQPIPFKPL